MAASAWAGDRPLARTTVAHRSCWAVVLGGRDDGLVFCGELRDRAPGILLSGDRFIRGKFGTDLLQNAEEDAAGRRLRIVPRTRPDVGDIGRVDGDIGGV